MTAACACHCVDVISFRWFAVFVFAVSCLSLSSLCTYGINAFLGEQSTPRRLSPPLSDAFRTTDLATQRAIWKTEIDRSPTCSFTVFFRQLASPMYSESISPALCDCSRKETRSQIRARCLGTMYVISRGASTKGGEKSAPLTCDQSTQKRVARRRPGNEACLGYFDRIRTHSRARVLHLTYARTYGRNACKHAEVARRMVGR